MTVTTPPWILKSGNAPQLNIPPPGAVRLPNALMVRELVVAPAFRKAAPVVVRVLLIAVGRVRVTCVGVIVLPPHTKEPAPMLDRLPRKVAVERAMVEGMVGAPEGGGYTAPLTEDTNRLDTFPVTLCEVLTPRLLIARAGIVAVGWMTGTHCPNIWMDETLLLM